MAIFTADGYNVATDSFSGVTDLAVAQSTLAEFHIGDGGSLRLTGTGFTYVGSGNNMELTGGTVTGILSTLPGGRLSSTSATRASPRPRCSLASMQAVPPYRWLRWHSPPMIRSMAVRTRTISSAAPAMILSAPRIVTKR